MVIAANVEEKYLKKSKKKWIFIDKLIFSDT